MPLLKINLYGESWTLKKFEYNEDDLIACIQVAAAMKVPLAQALLDPFFLLLSKNTRHPIG